MAAHRYWRASAIETYGGGPLELSEFHLLAGTTRVDAAASLSASVAPTVGVIGNLQDDVIATTALWADAAMVRTLALQWDFGGSPQDVTDIRLGSAGLQGRFVLVARLDYSDDGVAWTTYTVFAGITWPGPNAKTVSVWRYLDTSSPAIVSYMNMEGVDGGKAVGDRAGKAWTLVGGAVVSATQKKSGRTSVRLDGSTGYLESPHSADWEFGSGDWTIEMMVRLNGAPSSADYGCLMERWNTYGVFMNVTVPGNFPRFGVTTAATGTVGPVGANAIPFNEWAHVAFVRSGSNLLTFVNGVIGATATGFNGAIEALNEVMTVGRDSSGVRYSNVYLDEWRVTKGKAQYTANFDSNFSFIQVNTAQGRAQPLGVGRVGPGRPAAPNVVRALPALVRGRKDYLSGVLGQGIGRVRGFTLDYVNPLNKPYPCRVRLVRESDGLQMRETWSRADGSYDFQFVDELQSYTVIAYYLAHGKRAVVTDGLTLANGKVELMP